MKNSRRAVLWAALVLIILLIAFSIYAAFLGSERAEDFFNSLPLAIYWLALLLLLAAAVVMFRRMVHVPGLLLIHAGCILVLAGAVWGSEAGHQLRKKFFGIDKIRTGRMIIYEGQSDNHVILENSDVIKELPFQVELKDFRLEYYEPEYLQIRTWQGQGWRIPVELGAEYSLGPEFGTVKILRTFENFKIRIEDDENIAYEDPQSGYNAALEVQFISPDGSVSNEYVFERYPEHIHHEDGFFLSYRRVISEYISHLQIVRDNKVITEKNIEVNHPLSYAGYHFYQQDYDAQAGQYTILMVVSDTGLGIVYAGYLMLCLGAFWHFWLRHIFMRIKQKVIKWKSNTPFRAY